MASIFFYMKIEASKIQTPKDSFAEAKTDGFKDLNELAEKTPVIVKGKKINEEQVVDYIGGIASGYTRTEFKISEIIKNETSKELNNNDIITVIESAFYDAKNNTNVHVNGYQLMNIDDEYLLYMIYDSENDTYAPRGVTFGKIPLETNQTEILNNGSNMDSINVIKEGQKKYQK